MTAMVLLAFVGIFGLLMMIAIPNYFGWLPKYRAGTAIRQLFTEMQLAKQRAIAENNNYTVTFDTVNHQYTILDDDNSNLVADAGEITRTVVIAHEAPGIVFSTDPGDMTFDGLPPNVTFHPTGLSDKDGTITLKPSGLDHLKKKINVLTTGRIKIFYQ